ncbi:MAG: ferredoxin [Bdellovibrionales bacterium]
MAEKDEKWPDNKPGKFYVDQACIACDACVTAAPDNFIMDEDTGHAYVSKQPDGAEEEEMVVEALEGCPVEAIGDDGD